MTDFFKAFIEALKDGRKVFGILLFFSVVVLSLPEQVLVKIHCGVLQKEYGTIIGVIFLLSLSFWLMYFSGFLKRKYEASQKEKNIKKDRKKTLENLTNDEKLVIREYIFDGRTSVSGSIGDGIFGGLEAKDIIFRASQVGKFNGYNFAFDYNLQPWAKELLEKNLCFLMDDLPAPTELITPK